MMWRVLVILPCFLTVMAIRVPVDKGGEVTTTESQRSSEEVESESGETYNQQSSEETGVDSYLIPPNPHTSEEVPPGVNAPSTYLLPPVPNQTSDYDLPSEEGTQSDWQPVQNNPRPINILAQRPVPYRIPLLIKEAPKKLIGTNSNLRFSFPMPSIQLEPPLESTPDSLQEDSATLDAPSIGRTHNSRISPPPSELLLPHQNINQNFYPLLINPAPKFQIVAAEPTLALHLTPPKLVTSKYPTKLYPKKYNTQVFKPVPIPIYADGISTDVPKAKPLKPFTPAGSAESEFYPYDEKKIYQYQQAEQKKRLKEEGHAGLQQADLDAAVEQTYGSRNSQEPDASETNFRHPGRNSYPAPLRQAPPRAPQKEGQAPPAPGERTEFRMHGMNGPHSYQFGYDTGKGKNRQFRFEERDNDGRVRGHYGYLDKDGKMRVVNYNADPEHGFHADAPQEQPS